MGTPERYARVEKDIQNNVVSARNLRRKQKAVFLDRDGTLNRLNGFITKPDELELLEGAAEAVRMINDAGYLAIVATNQPVIARGECTLDELGEVHKKLETLLGAKSAYLDALFFCPHHPHKGFPGERPWYKRECECRKPKPGMLFEAARQFNIDLGASWMAGDKEKDVRAGKAAGCKTALIQSEESARAAEAAPDIICPSLLSFAKTIMTGAEGNTD
jgi:D-glycero-D-manno-heptose 1,7-bisphosphate phosphatase